MQLTTCQKEIIRLMKALDMKEEEKAISLMSSLENSKKAEQVIDQILDLDDGGETLTESKLIKIIATI